MTNGEEAPSFYGGVSHLDIYNWKGFEKNFQELWDIDLASVFIEVRKILSKTTQGLSSQQRAISLDLITTGIVTGIWGDETVALERMKLYWEWFKTETEKNAGLGGLLKGFIAQEKRNAKNGGVPLQIPMGQLRSQINTWVESGWLYEKPRSSDVKELMFDLGMRLQQGVWRKE